MGNPRRHYRKALQSLSHALVIEENPKLAKELFEEKDEEKLENFILEKKKELSEKEFYYNAGRTTQYVIERAEEEGCDSFNACCGGILEFEDFVEIHPYEDEE